MITKGQIEQQSPRGRWRSLSQLCELWGLSRTRARLLVDTLVRAGRMEVRRGPATEEQRPRYRAVSGD